MSASASDRFETLLDTLEGKKLTHEDKIAPVDHWNASVDEEGDDPFVKEVMERLFLRKSS